MAGSGPVILQGDVQLPSQVLCLACRTLACLVHQKFTKVGIQSQAVPPLVSDQSKTDAHVRKLETDRSLTPHSL